MAMNHFIDRRVDFSPKFRNGESVEAGKQTVDQLEKRAHSHTYCRALVLRNISRQNVSPHIIDPQ